MAKKKKQSDPLRVLTIDVSKWLIPENYTDKKVELSAMALGPMKCCLGFWANQIHGVTFRDMQEVAVPSDLKLFNLPISAEKLERIKKDALQEISVGAFCFETQASDINDDPLLTLPQRKRKLTALFKKVGIQLEFVGELRAKKL